MKKLQSRLFPNCAIPKSGDAGFFGIVPEGFRHEVHLYLSEKTVADEKAVQKAAEFFDRIVHWDTFCREILISFEENSEEYRTVMEYFDFYKEEVPQVFVVKDVSGLSLTDMVHSLKLESMASHDSGDGQTFVVDFTLGYDQILCIKFNSGYNYYDIAWES